MTFSILRRVLLSTVMLAAACTIGSGSTITGYGTLNGADVNWEAGRRIVTTINPPEIAPGDPNYTAIHGTPRAGYSGIAGLLINRPDGVGLCTGSLVNSFQILTAAHCLADANGDLVATSAQAIFFPESGGSYVDTSSVFHIHPDYSGSVFDDHDIAMLNLGGMAPEELDRYGLYTGDAVGEAFEVVGFGARGQGDVGAIVPSGTRARGFNSYDALFGGTLSLLGVVGADNVLLFDFDNGLVENDAFSFVFGPALFNLGLGIFESNTAPGDSGGPNFVDGRIAGINSFGVTLSFTDPDTGEVFTSDVLPGLNSSFGEFSGSTSIVANRAWIDAVFIPEPSSYLLFAGGLLALGFLRRRKP